MSKQMDIADAINETSDLFKSTDGEEFIVIKQGSGEMSYLIDSTEVADAITAAGLNLFGENPSPQLLKSVKSLLAYKARTSGEVKDVFHRIGFHAGAIYVDLGTGKYVEITKKRVKIVRGCPVIFHRPPNSLPLPDPVFVKDGFKKISKLVNVEKDDLWLIVAYLMAAFSPSGVYPVLVMKGEQGSAKTTTLRHLKYIYDPSIAGVQALHKKEEDVLIAAQNEALLMYDNVSYLSNDMSDVLCRLVSGAGLSKRKLYSNGESYIIKEKCPVGLNGIADFVTRGDLLDRSIIIEAPVIQDDKRMTERKLDQFFYQHHAAILGSQSSRYYEPSKCEDFE